MAPDSDPGQQSGESDISTRNEHPVAPPAELLFSSTISDASLPFAEGQPVFESVDSQVDGDSQNGDSSHGSSNGDSTNDDLARGLHDVGSITPPIFPGPGTTDVPPIDDVLGLNDLAFGQPSLSTIHAPNVEVDLADELAALFLPLDRAVLAPDDAAILEPDDAVILPPDDTAFLAPAGAGAVDVLDAAVPDTDLSDDDLSAADLFGAEHKPGSDTDVEDVEADAADVTGDGIEGVAAADVGVDGADVEEVDGVDISAIHTAAADTTVLNATVLDSDVLDAEDAPMSETGPLVVPVVESAGLFGGEAATQTGLGSARLWPDESRADEVVVEPAPDTQNLSSVGDLAGALKLSTEAARPGGMQWSTVIYEPGSEPPESDLVEPDHPALFVESAELPESERVRRLPATPAPVATSLIPGSLLEAAERRWFLTAVVGAVALSCGLLAFLVLGGDDGQTDAALTENSIEDGTQSTADAPPSSEFSEPLSPALSVQQESPVSAQLTQQTAPLAVEQAPAQPRNRSTSEAKSTTKVQSATGSATTSSSSTSSTSTTLPPFAAGPASSVPSTIFVTAPTTSTTARPVFSLTTVLQVGPPTVRVTTTRPTTTQRPATTRPRPTTTTTRPRPTTTTPRPTTTRPIATRPTTTRPVTTRPVTTRPTTTRPTPTTTRPTTTRPTTTTTRPTTTTTRPTTTTTRLTTTTTRLTTTTRPTTTTTRPTTTTTTSTTTTTRPTTTTTRPTTTTSRPTTTVAPTTTELVTTTTEQVTTTTEEVTTTTEEVTTTTEEVTTTTEEVTTTTEEVTTTTVDPGLTTTETTTPPASTLVAPLVGSQSTTALSQSTTRSAAA